MSLTDQIIWLFILAIPIACISWTVTHEEVFREPRLYFIKQSVQGSSLLKRKFFFLLTCEYCFSHYISIFILIITKYTLLFTDWRGYVIAFFSLVWIANVYMSLYTFVRVDIKKEKVITRREEKKEKHEDSSSPFRRSSQPSPQNSPKGQADVRSKFNQRKP